MLFNVFLIILIILWNKKCIKKSVFINKINSYIFSEIFIYIYKQKIIDDNILSITCYIHYDFKSKNSLFC